MALRKAPRRTKDDKVGGALVDAAGDDQPPVQSRVVLVVAILTLIGAMIFAFLLPRNSGDTFMTLAGGRDVFDGKLGQPDDWSFNSDGNVWIDQSWGTGVLYYSVWRQFGYFGIVVIKAVTIFLIGLFVVLAARQFGANYWVALIVSAFVVNAGASFIDMRANTLGLAMLSILLWTLYWSYGRPQRIWLAVALLTIWINMHGSFVFGVAILGLWTVTNFAVLLFQGRRFEQLKPLWTLPAATVLVVVLSCATSPFGITNLIQPFSLMDIFTQEEWPLPANEMTPTYADSPLAREFRGTRWYTFMLGCLAATMIHRGIDRRFADLSVPAADASDVDSRGADNGLLIKWVFASVLAATTIVMAVKAMRFMPISLIVCGPLVAFELHRIFMQRKLAWLAGLAIAGSVALAGLLEWTMPFMAAQPTSENPKPVDRRFIWMIGATFLACSPILGRLIVAVGRPVWSARLASRPDFARGIAWFSERQRLGWAPMLITAIFAAILYVQVTETVRGHGQYPMTRNKDLFGRLVFLHEFPVAAVEFLKSNEIKGNVLNDRTWEGFLHWSYPELKLMFGGRSRQVYSTRAARAFTAAGSARDYSYHEELGISLVAVPLTKKNEIPTLFVSAEVTPWRIIYYDGISVIAANGDIPESNQFILAADAGELVYPDSLSEKYSLAVRRLALSSTSTAAEILEATAAATKEHPETQLYQLLINRLTSKKNTVTAEAIVSFFESELVRLHDLHEHQSPSIEELYSRQFMAYRLASVYGSANPPQPMKAEFWSRYDQQIRSAAEAIRTGSRATYVSEIPIEIVNLEANSQ